MNPDDPRRCLPDPDFIITPLSTTNASISDDNPESKNKNKKKGKKKKKKDRKRKPKKPKGIVFQRQIVVVSVSYINTIVSFIGCPDPKLISGLEKIDIGLGDRLHYSKDFIVADGLYPRGTLVKAKCAEGHSLGGSPQTAARVRIRCTKQVRS